MKRVIGLMVAVTSLLGANCSSGDTRIVGFLVDGQTGKRLNLFEDDGAQKNLSDNADLTKAIYTVIDGKFVRATPCKAGDATETNKIEADGCYQIEGVKYGQELPIFAQFDGYERFHGTYVVPLPGADENGSDQQLANIRVFPKGFKVDYKILTNMNGRGLAGTTVECQIRQGAVANATDGHFLAPENTTSAALGGTSDDQGVVSISGNDLVNGASYHCEAFRSDPVDDRVLSGEADFVAGVSAPEVSLALKTGGTSSPDSDANLYAVRSNADNKNDLLGDPASLIITFNRPVELVSGTADCASASAVAPDTNGNGTVGKLPSDTPSNGESETVVTSLSADGLTLTIGYKPPTNAFEPTDFGTFVKFNGIYVRPVGGKTDANFVRRIGSATGLCKSEAGGGSVAGASGLKSARTGTQINEVHLF